MATIEPITRTIVEEQFVMTFSRAELEQVVKDPRPWLIDVRHVLNGSKMKPLKRSTPVERRAAKKNAGTGKRRAKKSARGVKASVPVAPARKFQCVHCDRSFKTQGWLNQHEAKMHGGGHVDDVEIGSYGNGGDD